MSAPFEVLQFSSANLFKALSNEHFGANDVAEQSRAKYLLGYLSNLKTSRIVVESEYTDGDYLEDFASYYVRCFQGYNRRCRRLHFFAEAVSTEEVRLLVLGELDLNRRAKIVASYLGFVVARPLPSAIVGRTLLAHYASDEGRRHYPVTDVCTANLFGVKLSVRSLPYQEQDSVLAACATVALWSAFHRTAKLFGTHAPRPASITRAASNIDHSGRAIPSRGLSIEAMCHAVSDIGLEPELIQCEAKAVPLVSLAYAHLAFGLPVILIARIGNGGLHAITLAGYSLRAERQRPDEAFERMTCVPMAGLRVDEFYGHDDQIGPFSRLKVKPGNEVYSSIFEGSWVADDGTPEPLHPVALLIPVYNKVRVTFLDLQIWLRRLTDFLESLIEDVGANIEWDVKLTTTNAFKSEGIGETLTTADRESLLFRQQPRFLWCAALRVSGKPAFDALFDATDMRRSCPALEIVWRHAGLRAAATVALLHDAMQASLTKSLTPPLLATLKRSI